MIPHLLILAYISALCQARSVPFGGENFDYQGLRPFPNNQHNYWNQDYSTSNKEQQFQPDNSGILDSEEQKYIPTIDGQPILIPPVLNFDKNENSFKQYSATTRPWHYWQNQQLQKYGYLDASNPKSNSFYEKMSTMLPAQRPVSNFDHLFIISPNEPLDSNKNEGGIKDHSTDEYLQFYPDVQEKDKGFHHDDYEDLETDSDYSEQDAEHLDFTEHLNPSINQKPISNNGYGNNFNPGLKSVKPNYHDISTNQDKEHHELQNVGYDQKKPDKPNENVRYDQKKPDKSNENVGYDQKNPDKSNEKNVGYDQKKSDKSNEKNVGYDQKKSDKSNEKNVGYDQKKPDKSNEKNVGYDQKKPDKSNEKNVGYDQKKPDKSNEKNVGYDQKKPDKSNEKNVGYDQKKPDKSNEKNVGYDQKKPDKSNEKNVGYDQKKPDKSNEKNVGYDQKKPDKSNEKNVGYDQKKHDKSNEKNVGYDQKKPDKSNEKNVGYDQKKPDKSNEKNVGYDQKKPDKSNEKNVGYDQKKPDKSNEKNVGYDQKKPDKSNEKNVGYDQKKPDKSNEKNVGYDQKKPDKSNEKNVGYDQKKPDKSNEKNVGYDQKKPDKSNEKNVGYDQKKPDKSNEKNVGYDQKKPDKSNEKNVGYDQKKPDKSNEKNVGYDQKKPDKSNEKNVGYDQKKPDKSNEKNVGYDQKKPDKSNEKNVGYDQKKPDKSNEKNVGYDQKKPDKSNEKNVGYDQKKPDKSNEKNVGYDQKKPDKSNEKNVGYDQKKPDKSNEKNVGYDQKKPDKSNENPGNVYYEEPKKQNYDKRFPAEKNLYPNPQNKNPVPQNTEYDNQRPDKSNQNLEYAENKKQDRNYGTKMSTPKANSYVATPNYNSNDKIDKNLQKAESYYDKPTTKSPKVHLTEASNIDRRQSGECEDCSFDTTESEDSEENVNVDLDQESLKNKFLGSIDRNFRSFVFNPSAQSHEKFQTCRTPTNESGSCRYVQHCLLPSIISAIDQFMDYVCIIDGRFIGVCCPEFPVTSVKVKWDNITDSMENSTENSTLYYPEDCGVGSRNRIVGGSKADPKDYPWMAALQTMSTGQFFCGGALINSRYVLTAAHCTYSVPKNQILVRLGEYDFSEKEDSLGEDYPVIEIKRHGQYSRRTLHNDIALLKLARPVTFASHIKTICLPKDNRSFEGVNATLAGWGNIEGGGPSSQVLLEATFPVISNKNCSNEHGLPISNDAICTLATPKDKGACNGDSGGPLMTVDDETKQSSVIGIVSWGRRGCNPRFPTVYARVTSYVDWIKKHAV